MALASDGANALQLALEAIFADSTLSVSLAGLTEAERRRNIAFYDEVIVVAVRLVVPASNRTVPAPVQKDHSPVYELPLPQIIDGEEDEDSDLDAEKPHPPHLLWLLIVCLKISLEAAYAPPRLARTAQAGLALASRDDVSPSPSSAGAAQVVPSVTEEDAAYQSVRLQGTPNDPISAESTRMVYKEWSGNTVPPKPELKRPASHKGRQAFDAKKDHQAGANVWFARNNGKESWTVEWRCEIPIVFLRSRHPTPALVLNANLTLALQPTRLSHLAPSLSPPALTSAPEALFSHDLLSPLSEGPSYPDESPAERAARADASLAKLPLGKLPSSVLGSKLVTPARAAREMGLIVERGRRLAMQNGDIGDADEWNGMGAESDLHSRGQKMDARQSAGQGQEEGADGGLGEGVIVVRRGTRKVLDVRTAVQVRMRTTNIAGVGEGFGREPNYVDQDGEDNVVPTLILCVEVENPANSGIKFSLDDVGVNVTVPSETHGTLHPSNRILVNAEPIAFVPKDLVIDQGSQYNILYRVDFSLPFHSKNYSINSEAPLLLSETQRTITIELFGRPILMRTQDTEFCPSDSFTSTWSCTLDFSTQIQSLVLQRVIAEGAGGVSLNRPDASQQTEPRVAMSEAADYRTVLPSVLARRRIESIERQGTSPLTARSPSAFSPATPTPTKSRPGFGRSQTENRLMSNSTLTSTSMRLAKGGPHVPTRTASAALASDAFVALQRAADDRDSERNSQDPLWRKMQSAGGADVNSFGLGPAMPSSLVGPSILARARKNRMATMGNLSIDASDRAASGRARRAATLVVSSGSTSYESMPGNDGIQRVSNVIPGRVSSSSWHVKNALSGSQHFDNYAALPIFPVGSKGAWARMPFMLQNATLEQGLLIDITASTRPSDMDENASEQPRLMDVQVQIDNRSETTRTVVLQWKRQTKDALDTSKWMPDDDAVQVGPIVPGQAELAMLRLRQCAFNDGKDDFALYSIPPIVLTDIQSGAQRTLTCVQPLLV